ncbi:MAG: succinyl-diaminopimelate desuccinylase [Gammaproteobacteria bacterium]
MSSHPTLDLACDLIRRASVTPDDAGCQPLLADRLAPLGFVAEHLRFADVDNLWLKRGGDAKPLFVFAGHTDVVPTGPREQWSLDPFVPEIRDGMLYGRGTADMKGSVAAFVVAVERFLAKHPQPKGAIALLLTSDEEGPSVNGTVKVVETLEARGEKIDWCIVGEPSATATTGDTVKVGRRGSLGGVLTVLGKQGHVAYPERAKNPIHVLAPALAELTATRWDDGNEFFPPTSFQVSNINAGTGANNVIPGTCEVVFNFRFCTEQTADGLRAKTEDVLRRHGVDFRIDWALSGVPFLTGRGALVAAAQRAIREVCGREPELSTTGGTSDGRFIAPTGAQVVEIGPPNATIHQIDERVSVQDLVTLTDLYERMLENLLA